MVRLAQFDSYQQCRLPSILVNGIYLYYRMSRFLDVMIMLKEEKPLCLYLNTITSSGYIGTGNEPVGEQEGI